MKITAIDQTWVALPGMTRLKAGATVGFCCLVMAARGEVVTNSAPAVPAKSFSAALSPAQWQQVEDSVDRALPWLASQQAADGSFPTLAAGPAGGDQFVCVGVSFPRPSTGPRSLRRLN